MASGPCRAGWPKSEKPHPRRLFASWARNVKGRATRLLALVDSRLWRSRSKTHFYHPVFLVELEGQEPSPGPETTGVGFFAEDDLPPLSPGHDMAVPLVFKLLRGEVPSPYFD